MMARMRRFSGRAWAVTVLLVPCAVLLGAESALVAQQVIEAESPEGLPYSVTLPAGYSNEGAAAPMILFLHGGDRSNTRHHPAKYATQSGLDFPFVVLAPHCAGSCTWRTVDFDKLLDQVTTDHHVDTSRVYLTGYSMGGNGSWDLLSRSPDWFAAAAPIAGWGDTGAICAASGVPVRAVHSDDDTVIEYSRSVEMVDALNACDGDAELITLHGVDHASWIPTFQDAGFYAWLLEHRRD